MMLLAVAAWVYTEAPRKAALGMPAVASRTGRRAR